MQEYALLKNGSLTVPVIDQAHHGSTDALSCYAHFLLSSIFRKFLLTLLNWSTVTFPSFMKSEINTYDYLRNKIISFILESLQSVYSISLASLRRAR